MVDSDKIIQAGNLVRIRNSTSDDGVVAKIHVVILNSMQKPIRLEVAEKGGKTRYFTLRRANGDYVERDTPTFSGPWLDMIWHPSQGRG